MESLVDRIQHSRSKPPTVGQTVAVGPVIEQAEVEIIDHPAVQQPGAGFVMAPKGQMVVNPLFAVPVRSCPTLRRRKERGVGVVGRGGLTTRAPLTTR